MRLLYATIICASISVSSLYGMDNSQVINKVWSLENTDNTCFYKGKTWERKIINGTTNTRHVKLRRSGWLYNDTITINKTSNTFNTWQSPELTTLSKAGLGMTFLLGTVCLLFLRDNETDD